MPRMAAVVALALTATACGSGGTALESGDAEHVPFTANNGETSEYHVYAQGVAQPAGLLIWLHGDGAYEFEHPDADYVMGGPAGVRTLAQAEGYVVVSARSPDRDGVVTWWEEGEADADYLASLIRHLSSAYRIDERDIVLAGFSGGAQQITQYFLPEHSRMLGGGGAIMFGGGGLPETANAQPWNQELRSGYFMHWATGALDDSERSDESFDAIGEARNGHDAYAALGFSTSHEWIPGLGHEFDGLFGGIVAQQLRAHPAP